MCKPRSRSSDRASRSRLSRRIQTMPRPGTGTSKELSGSRRNHSRSAAGSRSLRGSWAERSPTPYEVKETVVGERLVMATSEGPFAMETTYSWSDSAHGTKMSLRNRGTPTGFSKMAAPLMTSAMRRANNRDLERLKRLLEAP
jgi:hypothetical protein